MNRTAPSAALRPVICFGEALWDVLPDHTRPGGAPLNVAVHLRRLRRRTIPLSTIGRDPAGDQLLARISQERLPIFAVSRHPTLPTGRVDVTLDSTGAPSYRIAEHVAWDEIIVADAAWDELRRAAAIVFGTLAQRSLHNRLLLDRILGELPGDALRVLDVNMRPPHVDLDRLWHLARTSTVVKVNRVELEMLVGRDDVERSARALRDRLGNVDVCVTLGAEGAAMLRGDAWTRVGADAATVVDTVGAGDAFVAGLVDALLDEAPPEAALARGSALSARVVSISGAW